MRILWHSNAPFAPSGYGTQTDTIIWRLKERGHEIAVSCFFGLQGSVINLKGITMLPAGHMMYGADTLAADASWWQADIAITLMDTWVLPKESTSPVRWVPYFPVDHVPVPPAVLESIETAYAHIAYSKFGVAELQKAGISAMYVPHCIDTGIYRPVPMDAARSSFKLPDDVFMVGIIAANQGAPARKCFDEQIRAFSIFLQNHPDAVLYLHTEMTGRPGVGENIWSMLEDNKIPVKNVKVVDQYMYVRGHIQNRQMAQMFSALDVVMNVARGEGFGLTIAEAQACGTPVIVGNWTSMPELLGAGWLVDKSARVRSQDSYQFLPDVDAIVEQLENAYQHKGDTALREQAREFIVTNYDADMVVEKYWQPALDILARRIEADKQRDARKKGKAVKGKRNGKWRGQRPEVTAP